MVKKLTKIITSEVKSIDIIHAPSHKYSGMPHADFIEAWAVMGNGNKVYISKTSLFKTGNKKVQMEDYLFQNRRYKGKEIDYKEKNGNYVLVN